MLSASPVVPAQAYRDGLYLAASPISPTLMGIGWDAVPNASRYRLFRNGILRTTITDLAVRSYLDTTVIANTSYDYSLVADTNGASQWSGFVTKATPSSAKLLYESDFEQAAFSGAATIAGWLKSGNDTTKIVASTEQARSGSRSIKFDFPFSDWTDDSNGRRTMLTQPNEYRTSFELGSDYWVGISTYIPSDWKADTVGNYELLWQFHGGDFGPAYGTDPPVCLILSGQNVQVRISADATESYPFNGLTAPAPVDTTILPLSALLGKWNDWVVNIHFDYANGFIKVWHDGVLVFDFQGSNIYRTDGSSDSPGPFFNFGPYKWDWGNLTTVIDRRVLYADELRIGNSTAIFADVVPR